LRIERLGDPQIAAILIVVAVTNAGCSGGSAEGPLRKSAGSLEVRPSELRIEYIAHACFRIHSPDGMQLLVDPYASREWLGYDFPPNVEADAILITHPHYDHDAGQWKGHATAGRCGQRISSITSALTRSTS